MIEPPSEVDDELRKIFESYGYDVVRSDLGMGFLFTTAKAQAQARAWVSEQQKLQSRRTSAESRRLFIWTVLGAVSAFVAAIASLLALVRPLMEIK